MPEYRFIEWNEDNFDVRACPYVERAYRAREFAFVSDYARGKALYDHGGIYLDTDVEVLKPFDDLLSYRSFWGFEAGNFIAAGIIGAVPGHDIIKAYLGQYHTRQLSRRETSPEIVTRLWQERGLILNNERQVINEADLFLPSIYLYPYDYTTGNTVTSADSYTIHHYAMTWLGPWARAKAGIKRVLAGYAGPGPVIFLRKIFSRHKNDLPPEKKG